MAGSARLAELLLPQPPTELADGFGREEVPYDTGVTAPPVAAAQVPIHPRELVGPRFAGAGLICPDTRCDSAEHSGDAPVRPPSNRNVSERLRPGLNLCNAAPLLRCIRRHDISHAIPSVRSSPGGGRPRTSRSGGTSPAAASESSAARSVVSISTGRVEISRMSGTTQSWQARPRISHESQSISMTRPYEPAPTVSSDRPLTLPIMAATAAGWVQTSLDELDEPLRTTTFTVVDLETTGGSNTADGITEIGAVRVCGGEVQGEFQTLVDPGMPITPFVTVLTGITDAMVVGAPRIASVLPSFFEFARGSVLVAHNAPFDVGFLRRSAAELEIAWPGFAVVERC